MKSDTSFVAHFDRALNLDLTILTTYGGTATPLGHHSVPCDTLIELTATVTDICYEFSHWSSNNILLSDFNPYIAKIINDSTITANFKKIPYTVSLSVDPPNSANPLGGGIVGCSEKASISLVANSCWKFLCWLDAETGDTISKEPSFQIEIYRNRSFIAKHDQDSLHLRLSVYPPGTGYVNNSTQWDSIYDCGELAIYEATPRDTFMFSH
jgi:hypothetical protein